MAPYVFKNSLFLFLTYSLLGVITKVSTSMHSSATLCHDHERSALLHFKQSLSLDKSASYDSSAYPKTESWKARGESSSDCCSWHGVECNDNTGYVIGLHLSSSLLYGTLPSNSTIFSLVHLQTLNLADNNFSNSPIPPEITRLSSLSSLNLSFSAFSGQVPLELPGLSKLTSLDLSQNNLYADFPIDIFHLPDLLVLNASGNQNLTGFLPELNRTSSFRELRLAFTNFSGNLPASIGNLQSLTKLKLRGCYFSGSIPASIGNLTQLTHLSLSGNNLYGDFPIDIFHLPDLLVLDASDNQNLTGFLPEFNHTSSFRELTLYFTNFSGNLPASIGNLQSLTKLDLKGCYFSGSIPASIGNLTQLTHLSLSNNLFNRPETLSWLDKLTKLTLLDLKYSNLYGNIPPSLANLTQLTILNLRSNYFVGEIPLWLMNMTSLTKLSLASNKLTGPIPSSISQLKNLDYLGLHENSFIGTIDADIFMSLRNLLFLSLSNNKITLLTNHLINFTLPKLEMLQLGSCNLREIPYFLQFQNNLKVLILDQNNIHGKIPHWIWNASDHLEAIDLFGNFLTAVEQNSIALPSESLRIVIIDNNILQGTLPVPPPNTMLYSVSNNRLTGDISPMICGRTSLKILDLSNNSMSGPIPQCLANSLEAFILQDNNFSGTIPQTYPIGCNLKVMDLSQNQFTGKVPKSLSNCKMLQILDLSNNQMEQTFPIWLGTLPRLQVLLLHSNKFHGAMGSPRIPSEFPKLRIIDLSRNSLTGDLPVGYIQIWNAMKVFSPNMELYINTDIEYETQSHVQWTASYPSSITLTNKGVRREYNKILNIFTAIDLSSNKFTGQIPKSFGSLEGLQSLDLSNNELMGPIPPSLGNLRQLESLDLSQNKLTGAIPQQLAAQLHFLAFFNVSYNILSGPIPQGPQFRTFENDSYTGNPGLCAFPLSKKCATVQSPSAHDNDDDDKFPSGLDWVFILAGIGSGLVVGFVVGNILTDTHPWLIDEIVQYFGGTQKNRRRRIIRN